MARIRTIKPEFPQSETIGRLSRDARLLFVQLWTIADDEGRARASSRMLASLLYPYDDDARDLIDGWLIELEAHACVRRYCHEGSQYLEIVTWLKHQKIDKPSKSRLPSFDERSREVASLREASATDLGPVPVPRTVDQDGGGSAPARAREPLISEEAFEIATMVGAIAGLPDPKAWPPNWCGSPMRVMELLSHGWTRADFDAGARKAMSSRTEPPDSFRYFEKPIARAFASRTAPVPVEKPEKPHAPTRQRSALSSVLDQAIARAEEAERRDAEGGEDPVRLLSHG